jgi:ribose 5-phosphate isomerase B
MMRVALASDHAGFSLKEELAARLRKDGFEVTDLGSHSLEPVDYPDYALAIGKAVQAGKVDRGILVCGSGVGACIAVNKMRGIRAGLCHDTYSARQGVEHDDMNVLCLGARVLGIELAGELVAAFLSARFTGEERHLRRLAKIEEMETELVSAHPKTVVFE